VRTKKWRKPLPISRRTFITRTGASISALAFLRALPANAAASFRPGLLPSADQVWSDVVFVNNNMGPTRLTGSWQHNAYLRYLAKGCALDIPHLSGRTR
jgi:hypothetical protein